MMRLITLTIFAFLFSCAPRPYPAVAGQAANGSNSQEIEKQLSAFRAEIKAKQDLFADLEARIKQERADNQVLLEDMRIEIQQLRGDLAESQHSINLLRTEVERLRGEQRQATLKEVAKGQSDIELYDQILKVVLEEKDYNRAIADFRGFIRQYPKSTLADNAAYWIGEGYYAQQQYKEAALEFQKVIQNYPNGDKSCAALLKQAYCFKQLQEVNKAKLFFEETKIRCEGKDEAKVATKELLAQKSSTAPSSEKK